MSCVLALFFTLFATFSVELPPVEANHAGNRTAADEDPASVTRPAGEREQPEAKPADEPPQTAEPPMNAERPFPDLPRPITSFGAAVLNDAVYVYGGNFSGAHHYFQQGQSGELLRLNVTRQPAWKVVARGPALQGLALVAHGGKLYRIGGFSARNKKEEDQDLWSVADFAAYDPRREKWEELPPLPAPRSSFDAVVAGDVLYVVGGWNMQGPKRTDWHDTAWKINLTGQPPKWESLPKPPFQRRALSTGTIDGHIYALGGMQPNGKVTQETSVFDPVENVWRAGPRLPGEGLEGFGTACFAAGDALYVSTSSGKLLRLSDDRKSWQLQAELPVGRFFHRMLPITGRRLLLLGGASMTEGRYSHLDVVELRP